MGGAAEDADAESRAVHIRPSLNVYSRTRLGSRRVGRVTGCAEQILSITAG